MTSQTAMKRTLGNFTGFGYDKGRNVLWQALWFACQNTVFARWWCPKALRPRLLRLFGAELGDEVFIRHGVRVLWPWKLTIGSHCWIGEDVWLLNLEPIRIGDDVCLSQGAFLCTGSHDWRSASFEYDNASITVGDRTWVAAQALVLRGVNIGADAVLGARALVTRDVPSEAIVGAGEKW